MDWLDKLCGANGFMPHGYCYQWNPQLVWLHVISDAIIALAYFSIPFTLVYIVRKRKDLPFGWMFLCFGTFIIACGTTHLMEIWTLYRATYWLSGLVKVFTATASIITAILLVKLIPAMLAIPSPALLGEANRALADEVNDHKITESELRRARDELEVRVKERTGELEKANASLRDEITERKKVEEALRVSEERYRTLVEQSLVGIYVIQEGKFGYANPKLGEMLGYKPAELDRRAVLDFIVPEDRGLVTENIRKRMAGEVQSVRSNVQAIHRNGSRLHVETHGTRCEFNGGPAILGTVLDITERHNAEQEIRRLNAELEQRVVERTAQLEAANKELEAFSYSVSHDLRAPLRAIDGFSRILLQDFSKQLDSEGRRYLGIISQNAHQMGQLIDDLLAFSRLSRKGVDFSGINIRQLAESVISDLKANEPNRAVEFIVGEMPEIRGDAAMLRQVLINLVANAMKFTRHQKSPRIEIGARVDNGDVVFYVRDNGVGFDMQYAHKLFGVFQRLHRVEEFEGTGVGLAIVQRIIHRHGGSVWAEAVLGEGATFYFKLQPSQGKPS